MLFLVLGEAQDLCGGDGGAEDAEHHTGVKAPRHHRGNEVGGHPLHDLVAHRQAGDEVPSRDARRLRRDEGAGDDARARVGQHAEGVPLTARHGHLRVREPGAAARDTRAVDQDGGALPHARVFLDDERHGLPTFRRLGAEERGREPLERQALGAIDHRGREVVVAKPDDPPRELPAERCRIHRARE